MNYGEKISSSILLIYYISSFLFQASKTLDKKQIEMVFERFDLNKDGRLSKDEFQKLMTKYSNWNALFEKYKYNSRQNTWRMEAPLKK